MMRESKLAHINPVEGITNKMWSLFDILRSEPISSNDYNVILFLLSIYKDGYLNDILASNPHEIRHAFENRLRDAKAINQHKYLEIYPVFETSIQIISYQGLINIIQIFQSVDSELLKNHFSVVFDSILYRVSKSQGRFGGEFVQPVELTQLVINLVALPANATVFNPFAGLASFGVFLESGQRYFAQELNHKTWAIGQLRLIAYEKTNSTSFFNDDSILNWPDDNQKFDFIVANPPFGLKLTYNHWELPLEVRTVEQLFVAKGIRSLTQRGKLVAILPTGFLFRSGPEQRLREYLVDSDLLDSIISLPGGLLKNTGIPIVVLVINKAKKKPGYVSFIDGKDFVESEGLKEKKLDFQSLASISIAGSESDSVRVVKNQQIRELNFNLSIEKYFQKEFEGVKLAEILTLINGSRNINLESGKFVRIRDLKGDKFDYLLDEEAIETSELKKSGSRLIEDPALLLATRWKALKPTFFRHQGNSILLSNDILAFKVNESLVNIHYLVNELHSDYVQEQLESIRVGAVIPYIRRADLLNVKIKLPPLEEQMAKVEGLEELSNKVKELQQERNALVHGRSYSTFNEFASLKHTLGRPRQNILDWSDNLLHFISDKSAEIEKLNNAFSKFYGIDMISALNEIKRDINFMSEVLEKGENGFVLKEFPLTLVSLSDLNALINKLMDNGFNFKLNKQLVKGDELKKRGIDCNPILLRTMIDNILTNANKHGFAKKLNANEVVIELTEVEDQLVLEVKNNGNPFPKNFDKEKFISKYSTANPNKGSGLGGYDINRIAEYFNNPNWELILDEDPIYPVKFKFQFPVKAVL